MARILVVDDQEMMRDSLVATLKREGHDVTGCGEAQTAIARLGQGRFDLLITDLKMPRQGGIELLAEAKKLRPDLPVVLMTAFATVNTAVEAMKLGAYDYIQKPFDGEQIKLLVDRALEHSRLRLENQAYRSMTEIFAPVPLIGDSVAMLEVRQKIELLARSNATVLIRGESGCGKEVVGDSSGLLAPRAADAGGQLRGIVGESARIRTVRPRKRGLHRRRQAPPRAFRAGRRRNASA
jgi:DNA-binding NtrC family response regulator